MSDGQPECKYEGSFCGDTGCEGHGMGPGPDSTVTVFGCALCGAVMGTEIDRDAHPRHCLARLRNGRGETMKKLIKKGQEAKNTGSERRTLERNMVRANGLLLRTLSGEGELHGTLRDEINSYLDQATAINTELK